VGDGIPMFEFRRGRRKQGLENRSGHEITLQETTGINCRRSRVAHAM
jgi:hypothetical protein